MRGPRFSFVRDALQVLSPIRLVAVVIKRGGPLNAFHVFLRNRSLGRWPLWRVERNCRVPAKVRLEFLGPQRLGFRTLRPGRRGLGACRLGRVVRASLDRSCGFCRSWRQYWLPVCLLALLRHHFLRIGAGDRGDVCILPSPLAAVIPRTGKGRQDAQNQTPSKLKLTVWRRSIQRRASCVPSERPVCHPALRLGQTWFS